MKVLLLALFVAFAAAAPLDTSGNPVELIVNGVPEGQPLELSDIVDITVKEHADGEVVAQSNLLHPLTAVGMAEAAVAVAAAAESAIVEANPESPTVVEASPEVPSIVEASPEVPTVVEASPEIPVIVEANPEAPTIVEASPDASAVADIQPEAPVVVEINPETPTVVEADAQIPTVVEANPDTLTPPEVAPISPAEIPVIVDTPEASQLEPVSPVQVVEVESLPNPAAQAQNPSGEVYNDGMVQVQVNYPEEGGLIGTLKSWLSLALNFIQEGVPTVTHQII